jgi:hypothetical protein
MLAAGLALAPTVAASPTVEGGTPGTVTAYFSPSTVCYTGAAQSFTLTVDVSTLAAKGALKTLFVTVPSGYANVTVTNVTPSTGTPSVLTISSTTYIRVGGLRLGVGSSVTVTFSATQAGGTASWKLEGETGNDSKPDNDTPGGDDYYAPTLPTTQVALGCALSFAYGPADAGANQNITNAALTPTGTSVAVLVTDKNGVAVTASVTLGLSVPNGASLPAGAALTGGGSTSASTAAAALFGTGSSTGILSVNIPGIYTLTASTPTPGIASAISSTFVVWGAAQACASSPCTLPPLTGSAAGGETFNVSADSSGAIGASLDLLSIDCGTAAFGGVAAISGTDTITWTSSGLSQGAEKTTTIFIPDTTLATSLLAEVHYMVCVSAPVKFQVAYTPNNPSYPWAAPDAVVTTALSGEPQPSQWYRGLLPDCQDVLPTNTPPCVASRIHTLPGVAPAGVTVTILSGAGAGDPFGR